MTICQSASLPKSMNLNDTSIARVGKSQAHELVSILKFTTNMLAYHGIVHWMNGGTFLGAIRHGGLIPWDDDADLFVLQEQVSSLLSLRPVLKRLGFGLVKFWCGYKVYRLDGTTIKYGKRTLPWKYPFVDLFPAEIVKGSKTVSYNDVLKNTKKYADFVVEYYSKEAKSYYRKEHMLVKETFPLKPYAFYDFSILGAKTHSFFAQAYPGWDTHAFKNYNHEKEQRIEPPIHVRLVTKKPAILSKGVYKYEYPYGMWDQAYVLNLKMHPDRLSKMKTRLAKVGLSFVRHENVYKTNLDLDTLVKKRYHQQGLLRSVREANPCVRLGHTARYHAELSIFKDALKKGMKSVLIMEDDIFLRPDFIERVKKSWAELPSDWDIFFFDAHNNFRSKDDPPEWQKRSMCFSDLAPGSKKYVTKPYSKHLAIPIQNHKLLGGYFRDDPDELILTGAYGYVISEKGMRTYLKYARPMTAATNVQLGLLSFGKQHSFDKKTGNVTVVTIPAADKLKAFIAKPRLVCAQTSVSTTSAGKIDPRCTKYGISANMFD